MPCCRLRVDVRDVAVVVCLPVSSLLAEGRRRWSKRDRGVLPAARIGPLVIQLRTISNCKETRIKRSDGRKMLKVLLGKADN